MPALDWVVNLALDAGTKPDVLVVGAGSAGLAAAVSAARHGARVLLLDERAEAGGRLRYRIQPSAASRDGTSASDSESPREMLGRLLSEAAAAGVQMLPNTVAWGRFAGGSVGAARGNEPLLLHPGATVLCAGSTDLPLPFPGWSLPGVVAARAALILVTQWRVLPGRRWAVVGGHPDGEEVATALSLAGGEVVAVAPAGAALSATAGADGALAALAVDGERFAVDMVAVAAGRQPDPALAVMSGVAMGYDPDLGGHVPLLDAAGRTSDPRLLVAGEAAGVCSPEVARAEGRIAGIAAAAVVGRAGEADVAAALAADSDALAERLAIRRGLQPVYEQAYQ
jgi:hypothetical protein